MKNTNYSLEVTKNCKSCNRYFTTDVFDENCICEYCKDAYDCTEENNRDILYDEYEDVKYIVDSYVVGSCRTKAVRYD